MSFAILVATRKSRGLFNSRQKTKKKIEKEKIFLFFPRRNSFFVCSNKDPQITIRRREKSCDLIKLPGEIMRLDYHPNDH